MESYRFQPMTAADLPLTQRWLEMAHVVEWWGDPDEQLRLVRGDLEHPAMEQIIVLQREQPFAYLQCYDITAWPVDGFGNQPTGTRGIDQFIGEPDMINRGHGSAFIRLFIDRLLAAGTPRVLTDPDPTNARAIRAYEKAGFQQHGLVDTPDGQALLMVRNA
jgi:aminoglycoside 6'-N-acetyltransferase